MEIDLDLELHAAYMAEMEAADFQDWMAAMEATILQECEETD